MTHRDMTDNYSHKQRNQDPLYRQLMHLGESAGYLPLFASNLLQKQIHTLTRILMLRLITLKIPQLDVVVVFFLDQYQGMVLIEVTRMLVLVKLTFLVR